MVARWSAASRAIACCELKTAEQWMIMALMGHSPDPIAQEPKDLFMQLIGAAKI